MNFLASRTAIGMIPVGVSAAVNVLRACGVQVSPDLESSVNQLIVWAMGIYLLITGHTEALNTPIPPSLPVRGDTLIIGGHDA